ncbi:PREDICTED: LOC110749049 isoform [Prunus dulcis]|uniref:PREDICTED: LOC110749049 isoform n=1 Tax=Prunus dulcis TaxID=3755 RepID=A0A5E4G2N0_PRUDU|nr:PREDICTED: LOC110749049 isoform [Prunus dulcis]
MHDKIEPPKGPGQCSTDKRDTCVNSRHQRTIRDNLDRMLSHRVGNGSGFGYVGGNNLVVDLNPSPYAIRAPDPRFEVGAMYETMRPRKRSLQCQRFNLCLLVAKWWGEVQLPWATAMRISLEFMFFYCKEIVHTCSLDETELHNCLQEQESVGLLDRGPICQHTHVPLFISCSSYLYKCYKEEKYSILNRLRVFHLERPGLGLKEIAQEYNMNWDSSNTEVGSSILNLEFF